MSVPECKCGEPAKLCTVKKEGPNQGKQFWGCAKPQTQSCKFFKFATNASPPKPQEPQKKRKYDDDGIEVEPTPEPKVSKTVTEDKERQLLLRLMLDRIKKLEQNTINWNNLLDEVKYIRDEITGVKEHLLAQQDK